jgi:hypothetical protein
MPPKRWFAVRLRFAVMTDREGLTRFVDSVVMLQAPSREQAFEKALERGHQGEQAYQSVDGMRVRWGFAAIVAMDEIQENRWDGLELASIPIEAAERDREAFHFDHTFQPELSRPAESRA